MAGPTAGSFSAVQEHGQEHGLPVLLTTRQGFGSGGVAFEVPIKNPEGAKISTPGKLRLEAYGSTRSPAPGERKLPVGEQQQRLLRSEELAKKARESNEKARLTAERVRLGLDESAEAKRRDLEQDQEEKRKRREAQLAMRLQRQQPEQEVQRQTVAAREKISRQKQLGDDVAQKIERASEKRREVLVDRSTKAGRHFEEVKTKTEVNQQQKAEEHAARAKQLEAVLATKAALHNAGVVERGERAGHHNEVVAEKVQKHRQEVQKHNEELLAKHRQKCGSKIDGRPHTVAVEDGQTALQPVPRGALRVLASHLASLLPCPP